MKPGVLGAVSSTGAGVAGGTAVQHVAAAHRLWRRTEDGTGGAVKTVVKSHVKECFIIIYTTVSCINMC